MPGREGAGVVRGGIDVRDDQTADPPGDAVVAAQVLVERGGRDALEELVAGRAELVRLVADLDLEVDRLAVADDRRP